jgi:hypothetical protein
MPQTLVAPKAVKKATASPANTIRFWSYTHQKDKSKIEAYTKATGKNEIITEIFSTPDASAETIAKLIVKAVNNLENHERIFSEMEAALEMCLETGNLNWAAEHDADIALRHAKSRVKFHAR